jgi:endonuclease YncB( thermonuclease family)
MFLALTHPRNSLRALAAAAFAGACAVAAAAPCGAASGAATAAATTERAEVRLSDGRLVRLAGLDISEPAAARAMLQRDWVGRSVAVRLLAPRPDRWGRWLADLSTSDGESAAFDLLTAGLARVRPEFETRGCESERLDAEAAARAAGQGVWNESDSILGARDRENLEKNEDRFVVIEGAVRRVGVGRSRVYLDFDRRGGFAVVVARKWEPAFARRGLALGALAGRSVRVRGVLETRFGPRIELADPLMIEPAEAAKETKPGG